MEKIFYHSIILFLVEKFMVDEIQDIIYQKKKIMQKIWQNIKKFLFLVNLNEIIVSNEGFFLHIIAK